MCVYAHVCDAHAIIDLTATSGAVGAVQHVSEAMPSYLWTVFSYIPKQRENASHSIIIEHTGYEMSAEHLFCRHFRCLLAV